MKSVFTHSAVSTEESIQLLETYRMTGVKAERTLNKDPKLWDVHVTLPYSERQRSTPRSMINRMWG